MHRALQVVCLIAVLLVMCRSIEGAKKRKMRKSCYWLNKVPIHQKFNMNKFKGTWYTVARTTETFGDYSYESPSIQINKHDDNTYSYSLTGMAGGDKCIPVETGSLQPTNRTGLFHMVTPANQIVTMIISFTDYNNLAIVYYCFFTKNRRNHQCDVERNGMQVEILSKSENPDQELVKNYIQRAGKRLCVNEKRLIPTKPGLCKIPDLLAAAKKKEIDISKEKDDSKPDKCAVDNIPVQANFELEQMTGLWYEIARTRFTFNKLESVVTRHIYDPIDDVINSLYVGGNYSAEASEDSICMTSALAGMSRTKPGSPEAADMEGRIGGEESGYFWAPMKVLYADDDYLMFYACYYVGPDGHCVEGQMEVTLVGRTREITEETRDQIYSLLSDTCIDPNSMTETKFLVNCTDLVSEDLVKIERKPCYLSDIKPSIDYEYTMLEGTWYLFASIRNSTQSLSGVVVQKQVSGNEDPIHSRIYARDRNNDSLCVEYQSTAREMCLGEGTHIVTPPVGNVGNFYFSKILNVTEDFLIEFICTKRNIDGTCDPAWAEFHVYTKHEDLLTLYQDEGNNEDVLEVPDDDVSVGVEEDGEADEYEDRDVSFEILAQEIIDLIPSYARSVCLNPNDVKYETNWCTPPDVSRDYPDPMCDIDLAYSIMGDQEDFNAVEVYGYWYEVARTRNVNHLGNEGRLAAYFTSMANSTLQIHYSSLVPDGENTICTEVQSTTLIIRCGSEPIADYLAIFNETEDQITYVPYKILHTDGKNFMMTLVCEFVLPDGQCADDAVVIRIWSRNASVSREDILEVSLYGEWVCMETNPYEEPDKYFQIFDDRDTSCMTGLQYYVEENLSMNDDADETPEVDGGIEQQQDEPEDDFISDIDWELGIPDEEFYA